MEDILSAIMNLRTRQNMDTFWQDRSHCRSGLGEDTDRTWTRCGRSVHTVGQDTDRSAMW
jgi:hypothetical protein